MLWVYGHYNVFNSFSAGTDFRRQKLTSKVDPLTKRVNILVLDDNNIFCIIYLVSYLFLFVRAKV